MEQISDLYKYNNLYILLKHLTGVSIIPQFGFDFPTFDEALKTQGLVYNDLNENATKILSEYYTEIYKQIKQANPRATAQEKARINANVNKLAEAFEKGVFISKPDSKLLLGKRKSPNSRTQNQKTQDRKTYTNELFQKFAVEQAELKRQRAAYAQEQIAAYKAAAEANPNNGLYYLQKNIRAIRKANKRIDDASDDIMKKMTTDLLKEEDINSLTTKINQ